MSVGDRYKIDMCHGPLFGKILRFSIPMMAAYVMQFLFNAVDLVVVGRYASADAMAAVGSCSSLVSTILSVFFGLSVGANVLVARYIGAKDRLRLFRSVHTAVAIALYGGVLLAAVGWVIAAPMLALMRPPPEVMPKAVLYVRLYCAAIPFILLYNFGSSILRADGDTRRPLYYMIVSGIVKTGLNLFLVRVFHWDVGGVAVATLLANAVSSSLVLRALVGMRDGCRLYPKRIRFYWRNFIDNLRIGIPAGVQGSLFGVSNVIIQSTVNSFGAEAMAGTAAAASLESIVYVAFISYYFSAISFVGQNHGAKKYKRIVKSIWYCLLLGVVSSALTGAAVLFWERPLLAIYNPDPGVIHWGVIRLKYLVMVYYLCAIMEVLNGALRGLGHSLTPMVVTILGACFFRVAWVLWIFPLRPTMDTLLISYSVSWILVSVVNGVILTFICRRMLRDAAAHRNA
ncbi:MAG: MATE family efflux transporter [Lentisphaeria bacterium]|nr:MATE family efflux transporter [Lentisphaeria bacterium]